MSMDEKDLDADFVQRVRNFKIRGSSGKLNIALGRLAGISCPERQTRK